jgi:D-tyrosyl-tRNA(Tyr) deacylase
MRAVVQRVASARVEVEGAIVGQVGRGLLVYLGAGRGDTAEVVPAMARKIETLRIFQDEAGKMSLSVRDLGGGVLVVPQFTLYGDVRKGRRPSFDAAAPPELALALYDALCAELRGRGLPVETGRFRATMSVHAEVSGPVTILIDSDILLARGPAPTDRAF